MKKILVIAWKEVYVRFTDRNLLLLMIVTPLAIATIIGLAFSQIGGSDIPIQDIPVAVLNLDDGGEIGVNFGEVYVRALIPGEPGGEGTAGLPDCELSRSSSPPAGAGGSAGDVLARLTEAELFDSSRANSLIESGEIQPVSGGGSEAEFLENAVRSAVEAQVYTAAIIIPENFTEEVAYQPGSAAGIGKTDILVFADGASPISGGIIHSIVASITNRIVAGNIALAASFQALNALSSGGGTGPAGETAGLDSIIPCAFVNDVQAIRLEAEEVEGFSSENVTLALFVRFGAAQAMFFGLFTAGFGVLSMYDERRNWTLQRLLISPTPRPSILTGKLVGVFLTVLFQVTVLLLAMTAIASVVTREPVNIWGDDAFRTAVVAMAAAFSVTGFGMFVAGVARSPEQGQIFISIFSIGLAVLGGSFGFILPDQVAQFSLIYWGRTAFETLAFSGGEVLINVVVLFAQGAIFYLIGLYVFNRRFELS